MMMMIARIDVDDENKSDDDDYYSFSCLTSG